MFLLPFLVVPSEIKHISHQFINTYKYVSHKTYCENFIHSKCLYFLFILFNIEFGHKILCHELLFLVTVNKTPLMKHIDAYFLIIIFEALVFISSFCPGLPSWIIYFQSKGFPLQLWSFCEKGVYFIEF